MQYEEPEGCNTDHKILADWSDSESESESDSEPEGYIVIKLQIKKTYKNILSEEELIP